MPIGTIANGESGSSVRTKINSAIGAVNALGTAANSATTDFATAAQGALADSAVQPADIGTAAAEDVGYFATAAQGAKADTALQPDEVKSANFTAAVNGRYVITASATVTDPSPEEGKGYVVVVRNGTVTIGGVAYSTAGQQIRRIYHSGGWATYADLTEAALAAATGKTTPVDADTVPLTDSAASNVLKKVTWANIKATLKTYFDTLYAAVSHTHAISDVTGLQTALDGKAASSHTHAISDVTGLQTALDGKAASSHTHSASDLTSLPLRLSVPFSDQTTDFTTGTKFTFTWRFGATTLSSTPVDVTVAPTGSAAQFNVTKNGTTIYSTKPTIDAGETSTSTAATPAVLSTTSIANGDVIAIIIDQKGSSTAGKGGIITFLGTLTV